MLSPARDSFLTYRDWFEAVQKAEQQPIIFCHTSALECLQLFPGYGGEKQIDVYASRKGNFENINYHILNNFKDIETVQFGNLNCASLNQTVNDMLRIFPNTDWQALVESLAKFYCKQNGRFDGLTIEPEYMDDFNFIREGAEQHFAY